jgi:hypothetical protein
MAKSFQAELTHKQGCKTLSETGNGIAVASHFGMMI